MLSFHQEISDVIARLDAVRDDLLEIATKLMHIRNVGDGLTSEKFDAPTDPE